MKILFLGTGAADYEAADRGTAGYRRNSSVLIDGALLIDPGPCVPDAIETFGVDIGKIKYVINTHRHADHFNLQTLSLLESAGAKFIELSDGEVRTLDGYTVTALRGNHSIPVQHFIIDDGKSRLFYGLDSAWLMYDEISAIKQSGVDMAVLDGTVGFSEGDYRVFEHNDMRMVIEMSKTLCSHAKRICINHMAKTLHTDHDTLAKRMTEHNIEVAYDGAVIEI